MFSRSKSSNLNCRILTDSALYSIVRPPMNMNAINAWLWHWRKTSAGTRTCL